MNRLPEKENRELHRLKAQINRPKPAQYLFIAMLVLTVIYMVDEITSNINSAMQPYVLFDLFNITRRNVTSPEYTGAINKVAPWTVASNLFLIISFTLCPSTPVLTTFIPKL